MGVEVKDLRKNYGDVEALRGVSFEVRDGEIFGLVGPNGAGKTTTLRIISTLIGATSGSVNVYGHDVEEEPNKVREIIRYLPEEAGAYENLSGEDYLKFIAGFYSENSEDRDEIVKKGIEIASLDERIEDKTSEYSKGMMRRLLVASALMTDPELIILDEPTSGLDVRNSREVREIIKDFPGAVMLSSHNMLEVEYLCDRVALINEGEIVGTGTTEELEEKYKSENLEDAFLEATKMTGESGVIE